MDCHLLIPNISEQEIVITITRQLQFDAGHRVLGHEGKCANLHGHRYVAEIEVAPLAKLDSLGRVVDFSVIKEKLGGWIEEYWDHNLLLHKDDPLLVEAQKQPIKSDDHYLKRMVGRHPYIMPNGNPTAENMAEVLFMTAKTHLPRLLKVVSVTIHETPNCKAKYQP